MKKINIINEKNNLLKEYFVKGQLNHKISHSFLNLLNDVEEKTEERLVSILENGIIFNEDHTQYMRSSINYTMEGDRVIMILLGDIDTPKHIKLKSTFSSNSVNYDYEDAICFIVNRAHSNDYYITSHNNYNFMGADNIFVLASILFKDEASHVANETTKLAQQMEINKFSNQGYVKITSLKMDILKYFLRYINDSNTVSNIDDYTKKSKSSITEHSKELMLDILHALNTDIMNGVLLTKEDIMHRIKLSAINNNIPDNLVNKLYIRELLNVYDIDYYINNRNGQTLVFSIEEILAIQYSLKNIMSDAGRLCGFIHFIDNPNIKNVRVEAEDIDSGKIIKGSSSLPDLLVSDDIYIDDKYYSYKDIEILTVSYRSTTLETKDIKPILGQIKLLLDDSI